MKNSRLCARLPLFPLLMAFMLLIAAAAACAPAAAPSAPAATEGQAPAQPLQPTLAPAPPEVSSATEAPVAPAAPAATQEPAAEAPAAQDTSQPRATAQPGAPAQAEPSALPTSKPAPAPVNELRVVELEWPESMRLGDSDVIRLSLIPSEDGYTAKTEYGEHSVVNQDVSVVRPPGYQLRGIARLDGAGFEITPGGEQAYLIPPMETVTWRWSLAPRKSGQQRLSIRLLLRWEPEAGSSGQVRESIAYDRGLEVQVTSFLGLERSAAATFGVGGLALSAALSVFAWRRPARARMALSDPNPRLSIEAGAGMRLSSDEQKLIRSVFRRYARLVLVREFLSGYSGARTFLARPLLPDGQADADTIIKIGPTDDIRAEYEHYESYVKDRLPPITARIQTAPVSFRGSLKAGLRYTCISEPGKSPVSLRQALLERGDPALIRRLFDSFGPYWWMQRRPYSFRLAEEYDRLLPPLLVLEPVTHKQPGLPVQNLRPATVPDQARLKAGDLVSVERFPHFESRADGVSLTLHGQPAAGQGALRLRWLSLTPPNGTPARVCVTRADLFRQYTAGLDLLGLPDPLPKLDGWLQESVAGTRSIIHGDLNLENVLVGPGDLVWLIDFARTREGHPLFDFAHLASELIGHVLVEQYPHAPAYLTALRNGSDPLLEAIHEVAESCLFNRSAVKEYHLTLALACLGALKYQNLTDKARQFLYLTSAFYGG